jgi:hypothetical protein
MRILRLVDRLAFPVKSALPLAVMRIGVSAVLLFQAALMAPEVKDFWGSQGYLQRELNQYIIQPGVPFLIDFAEVARRLGTSADTLTTVLFLLYVASLAFLLMGYRARLSAAVAGAAHLLLKFNQGQASTYGVDSFAQMFLFYCMVFPVGDRLSVDVPRVRDPRLYGFALRVMQVHLAIAYFSSGIAKAMGEQWRNGEVIWRAFNLPQFHTVDMSWLAHTGPLVVLIAWATLILEIGYPFLLGWRRTRFVAALAILGMHAGIAAGMGLVTFGLFMMVLTGSLFLVPSRSSGLSV